MQDERSPAPVGPTTSKPPMPNISALAAQDTKKLLQTPVQVRRPWNDVTASGKPTGTGKRRRATLRSICLLVEIVRPDQPPESAL